jgi:hypothetical protein
MSTYSPKTIPHPLTSLLHAVSAHEQQDEDEEFVIDTPPPPKKEENLCEMHTEDKIENTSTEKLQKKERSVRKKRKDRNSSHSEDGEWNHNEKKEEEEGKKKKKKKTSVDESQMRKAKEMIEKLRLPFNVSYQELEKSESLISLLANTHDTYYRAFPNFRYTLLTWKANNSQLAIRQKKKKTLTLLSDDDQVYYMVFANDDDGEEDEPLTSVKGIRQRLLESWKCTYAIENKAERPKKPYPSPHEQLSYLVEKKSKDITIKKYKEGDALASAFFIVYRLNTKEEEPAHYHWFANNIMSHSDKVQLVIVPKQHTNSTDDLVSFASFLDARDRCIHFLTKGGEEEVATVEEESLSLSAPDREKETTTIAGNLQLSQKSIQFLEILEGVVTAYSDKRVTEERLKLEKEKDLFEKEKQSFLIEKERLEEKKRKFSTAISLL